MNAAPKTTEAFDELISMLGAVRDRYVLDPARFTDPIDVAEAYRYVGQALSAMSEMFLEADPDHPRFVNIVTPARKLQGDNPDAIYHYAPVSGDRSYRVTGRIDRQCYTSFTVHGEAADGGFAGPLLGDVNDRGFDVADDGTYELVFSADQQPGNWLELHPDAVAIVVRSYFQLPVSAQNDPSVSVEIDITTIDDIAPPPPLDDATLAARMMRGVGFLEQLTVGQNLPGTTSGVPFVSNVANDVPTPFSFRDSGLPVPGAADIFYAMGRWDLRDDEALVMTGTLPSGVFANVMLWNAHMQTLNYRDRTASLNAEQIQLDADGSYRIVVSAQDPGVANWLDTEGHGKGTVFWRFLLPDTDPSKPDCAVVKIADIG